jgi:hypothetical protein
MTIKRLVMITAMVSIVVVQETLLTILPNIQLTVLLLFLFSSVLSFKESLVLVFVYVFADSLIMGSLYPLQIAPLIIAWSLIPMMNHSFLKNIKNEYIIGITGMMFSFLYGLVFIPFRALEVGVFNFKAYFVADLPFEIIMAISSLLTIIWLYRPLKKVLDQFTKTLA